LAHKCLLLPTKTILHAQEDGAINISYRRVGDERLSLDLLRGRDKSNGGDLDIDDKGSEQNIKPLKSLHHDSVGY
jgi:predicted RNA-binding protein (virulence factor B family)